MNLQKIEKIIFKFFIVLVAIMSSNTVYAKTYTRSCKATIQIIPKDGSVNKVVLHKFQAEGTVGAYLPNKARRRARGNIIECVNALWLNNVAYIPAACRESNKVYGFSDNPSPLGFKAYLEKRLKDANTNIHAPHTLEADVKVYFEGDKGCGGGIKSGNKGTIKLGTIKPPVNYSVCGDGDVDPGEQCDEGSGNSDTTPNGCRSDCRFAYCGDGVIDQGEQCDGRYLNDATCGDFSPYYKGSGDYNWEDKLACTDSCKYDFSECRYCGDGIKQSPQEECDDGNNLDDDGCNTDCTACTEVNTNLGISQDTELCTKNYDADDYGDLGTIIIKSPNVVLNCDGAKLTGHGDGIGIYIKRSDNVTVMNCKIDNYEYGIYAEDSQNIHILNTGNKISNTADQIVLDESSVDPTPPLSPSAQAQGSSSGKAPMVVLPSPRLTTSRIDSRRGDLLKMSLINKGKGKGARKPATPKRRGLYTPVRKVPVVSPIKVKTSSTKPSKRISAKSIQTMPNIVFPKEKQRFTYPVHISVKASYNKRRKVIYIVQRLSDKRIIRRTSRAMINNLPIGNYCLTIRYTDKKRASSRCVEFSVSKKSTTTIRKVIPRSIR